jgi:hypothetical protein
MPSRKTGGSLKEASTFLRNLLGTGGSTRCSLLALSDVLLQGDAYFLPALGRIIYHVPGLVVVLYI